MPMSHASRPAAARRRPLGRAALLATAIAAAALVHGPALAASAMQSHSVSFTGAGGDLTYGNGDTSTVNMVEGFLPLFDTALGSLERVSLTLSGWRSFEFTCTQGMVGTQGGCNAGVNGLFILDSVNYPVWSFLTIAQINPRSTAQVGMAPPPGTSLSATVYAEASTSLEVTDPLALLRHFTNTTGSAPFVDYRLRFQGQDGGSAGQGGAAAITAFLFDGDATLNLNYHYVAAIPEPGSAALWLAGLAAVAAVVRRRSRR